MPTSDRKTKVQTTCVILMFLLVFGWAQGLPGLAPEAWGANPAVTTPAPGSTLAGSTATFTWEANGTAVTEWWLYVGKSRGTKEVLTSGSIPATTLSRTVTGIPTNGSPVWVRLWWKTAAKWHFKDVQYRAATQTGGIPAFTEREMTVAGLKALVDRHGLRDVNSVQSSVPEWYRYNDGLVETRRTGLPSSLEHPRLILSS